MDLFEVAEAFVRNVLKLEKGIISIKITLVGNFYGVVVNFGFLDLGICQTVAKIIDAFSLEEFIGAVFHAVVLKGGQIVGGAVEANGKSAAWRCFAE